MRDGFVESVHHGHVAIADARGAVLGAAGDPEVEVFPRSALKPLQAAAVVELLAEAGTGLDDAGIAIACASHSGSAAHQVEAARLLSLAGLDEQALQCPPALPAEVAALRASDGPDRLAHNCSGKHAAFLLAQVAAGQDPARYRETGSAVQRAVARAVAEHTGATPTGPGVDGCGAPAWRLPLRALATAFARLAGAGSGQALGRVAGAMRARPDLVGGASAADTLLMLADSLVVAKRGAEAVYTAGTLAHGRALGVAVKIADGGTRAATPVLATVLAGLGSPVPEDLARPPVLGGGRVHGHLEVTACVAGAVATLLAKVYHRACTGKQCGAREVST